MTTRNLINYKRVFSAAILIITFSSVLQVSTASVTAPTGSTNRYEFTITYLDIEFTGITEISRTETTNSLTTYFGTYPNVAISTWTDTELTSTDGGYLELTNCSYYYDQQGYLRKRHYTWLTHLSGYQPAAYTMEYEYGNYNMTQLTESAHEETYTRRYYENGEFVETTECRDLVVAAVPEEIDVPAGNFYCDSVQISKSENGTSKGHLLEWTNSNGILVQQIQVDENGNLVAVRVLVPPEFSNGDFETGVLAPWTTDHSSISNTPYRVHSGTYGLHLGRYSESALTYYPAYVEQAIFYKVDSLTSSALTFWMRAIDTRVRVTFRYSDDTETVKTFANTDGVWKQYRVSRSELEAGKTIISLKFERLDTSVNTCGIDDITVNDSSTSTSSTNPAAEFISDPTRPLEHITVMGTIIMIALAGLCGGYYLMNIRGKQKQKSYSQQPQYRGRQPRKETFVNRQITLFCRNCGKSLEPADNFCMHCGRKV
ncbi:MAG: zinc-ribbon domain-containing protein [Candidatus Odinarchaeota archaeon]